MNLLPINQLLLRNPEIINDQLLVVNAPNDQGLFQLIKPHNSQLINFDMRIHQACEKHSLRSEFGLPSQHSFESALFYWPKAKPFAHSLLRWLASQIKQPTTVFLLAANDAGGKSLNNALKDFGEEITKLDVARKCSLWSFKLTPIDDFSWEKEQTSFTYDNLEDEALEFTTLPGVFNAGKLDVGTKLLLDNLKLNKRGRVLDLACGSGVIGLTCKSRQPELYVEMVDIDGMALTSAELNAKTLGLDCPVFASDGLSNTKKFNTIICNPPFHQGKETDYNFAQQLIRTAKQHLLPRGEVWIVANRQLAYEQWAEKSCNIVETVVQGHGFKVLRLKY
jgi:16S rRNA (guanine1207-N2)-methyltransferase